MPGAPSDVSIVAGPFARSSEPVLIARPAVLLHDIGVDAGRRMLTHRDRDRPSDGLADGIDAGFRIRRGDELLRGRRRGEHDDERKRRETHDTACVMPGTCLPPNALARSSARWSQHDSDHLRRSARQRRHRPGGPFCPTLGASFVSARTTRFAFGESTLERRLRAPSGSLAVAHRDLHHVAGQLRARLELRSRAPPLGDVAHGRHPNRGVGRETPRDARQRRHELRRRQHLRVIAQHVVAAERAHALVFAEKDRGERVERSTTCRAVAAKSSLADASNEHQRVASDAKQLGRRSARVVRAEQVVALLARATRSSSPCRTAPRADAARAPCCRRARASRAASSRDARAARSPASDHRADDGCRRACRSRRIARVVATVARTAARARRQIERRSHARRAQRVDGVARVGESALDVLRDRRRGALAARPRLDGGERLRPPPTRRSCARAVARSRGPTGARTTSESSKPQYTTRRPSTVACVSAASSSGSPTRRLRLERVVGVERVARRVPQRDLSPGLRSSRAPGGMSAANGLAAGIVTYVISRGSSTSARDAPVAPTINP